MIHKWIPLETVLADIALTIPTLHWSEGNVKELAFQAIRKIGVIEQYQLNVDLLPIENYRGNLPDDYYKISLMAYKLTSTTPDAEELERIRADLNHDNDLYYTGFSEAGFFLSSYRPMRLSRSPFALSVHCTDCINLHTISEHTYTLHPNNSITTSFAEGSVCIAYRSYAKDCDGNYLIPDNQDYIDAVRTYVLMRIWEFRMNTKEDSADKYYMLYANQWSHLRRMVVGEMKKPSVDQLESLRQNQNRLIQKERDFYRAFSNRPEERTSF